MPLPKKVTDAFGRVLKKESGRGESLWKGPEVDGITYSMLSNFLVCRERFRIKYVEGLKPVNRFNHRIEYGQMWHVCEEAHAKATLPIGGADSWKVKLRNYVLQLFKLYPLDREEILHWNNVCNIQFPIYVEYWNKHPDVTARTPLMQEQVFDVPYKLPSGRTVRLRGKWDSVDLIGDGKKCNECGGDGYYKGPSLGDEPCRGCGGTGKKGRGIYLQENKTKGDIHEPKMQQQLSFDLQTMMYLTALMIQRDHHPSTLTEAFEGAPIRGIRYNVVRRPLSGGKGSIKQHQPTKSNPRGESSEEFHERLYWVIREDPGYFFMRWKVDITTEDIAKFRKQTLNPILEQLCDWWEWVTKKVMWPGQEDPFQSFVPAVNKIHWRHPFGVYNVLNEGGSSDYDEYLDSGNSVGLERAEHLFEELK